MTGKITIEAGESTGLQISTDIGVNGFADKVKLVDALLIGLQCSPIELFGIGALAMKGEIGRRDSLGKTVVSADVGMLKKMLEQRENGD